MNIALRELNKFIEINSNKISFCNICNKYKDYSSFHKGSLKNGLKRTCKSCDSKDRKEYYINLPIETKNFYIKQAKIWGKNNPEKMRIYNRNRRRKPEERISKNLRGRVSKALKSFKTNNLLFYNNINVENISPNWFSCSYKDLIKYLESKFKEGMTWDNYGNGYNIDKNKRPIRDKDNNIIKVKQWQIDHIKPTSSFDLFNPDDRKKVNHYTNLLPMWIDDNLIKTGKDKLCPIEDKELLTKYPELQILI